MVKLMVLITVVPLAGTDRERQGGLCSRTTYAAVAGPIVNPSKKSTTTHAEIVSLVGFCNVHTVSTGTLQVYVLPLRVATTDALSNQLPETVSKVEMLAVHETVSLVD
jgi:hypothetical protein